MSTHAGSADHVSALPVAAAHVVYDARPWAVRSVEQACKDVRRAAQLLERR